MIRLLTLWALFFVATLLVAPSSRAQVSALSNLEALQSALTCRSLCAEAAECLGQCPGLESGWNKNGDAVIDAIDYQLAVEEYWAEGDEDRICYRNDQVVPREACDAESCAERHPASECADHDQDGLLAYQEEILGTSDQTRQTDCSADADCTGAESCFYSLPVNRKLCLTRTAFHLETAASNHDEVVVHVFYDHSPEPARALQLRLNYDPAALKLTDVRPLPRLGAAGKQVAAEVVRAGQLRLVVYGTRNLRFVPEGRIVELVFTPVGDRASAIGFSRDPLQRRESVAPSTQGTALLAEDAFWGRDLSIPARSSDGSQLILYYAFDDRSRPLELNAAPSGALLCQLSRECSPAVGRQFARLQEGRLVGGTPVEGVQGNGVFFEGEQDHLELPIWLRGEAAPLHDEDQSYAMGTWFYFEPKAVRADRAILLAQSDNASQRARYGLAVEPSGEREYNLLWFYGDLSDPAAVHVQTLRRGLLVRRWTHVAYAVHAGASSLSADTPMAPRSATVYLDGSILGEGLPVTSNDTPRVMACPDLDSNGKLQLEAVQYLANGRRVPVERIFLGARRSGQLGVHTTEMPGLTMASIQTPGEVTDIQDPDYSAEADEVLYSARGTQGFEIWMARGDGTEPRQITSGFGDQSVGVVARRPRWSPDGKGFVFESNAFAPNGFNARERAFHLYYVTIDEARQEPVDTNRAQRITPEGNGFHYRRARFGRPTANEAGPKLWVQRTRLDHGGQDIVMLSIPQTGVATDLAVYTPPGLTEGEFELLAQSGPQATTPLRLLRTTTRTSSTLLIQRGADPAVPLSLTSSPLDAVTAAAFSPRADRLLLAGTKGGRPRVVVTRNLHSAVGADTLALEGVTTGRLADDGGLVESLDWEEEDRLAPCGWAAGVRTPSTGVLAGSFRGALDELKVYNYARGRAAFRSEAERGRERLVRLGRGGTVAPHATPCRVHSDCPPQFLCRDAQDGQDGVCEETACDPGDPASCPAGSRCTLAAITAQDATARWRCASDCVVDADCFRQQCANGPCRFCDEGLCGECRNVSPDEGAGPTRVEGCPDPRTFACEDHTCVSECYRREDDRSTYQCDPLLERCAQGACQADAWSWSELAPATFASAGQMSLEAWPPRTVAQPQRSLLTLQAYGVEDMGHPPVLRVEAKRAGEATWLRVGELSVPARRSHEAEAQPLSLAVPFDFAMLRVSLAPSAVAPSRLRLGYDVSLPTQPLAGCVRQGESGLPPAVCFEGQSGNAALDPGRRFLHGGGPAVVILALELNGSSLMSSAGVITNKVCTYDRGLPGPDQDTMPLRTIHPGVSALEFETTTQGTWALLNCAPNPALGQAGAVLELTVAANLFERTDSLIVEGANGCSLQTISGESRSCLEWMGGGPTFDPLGMSREPVGLYDLEEARSFGWGSGSPYLEESAP